MLTFLDAAGLGVAGLCPDVDDDVVVPVSTDTPAGTLWTLPLLPDDAELAAEALRAYDMQPYRVDDAEAAFLREHGSE